MTAINHALTGAVIGLVVGNPAVALVSALLSHFICDALPHYGSNRPDQVVIGSRRFAAMLLIDASLCGLLVFILALNRPVHWLLAAICAFVATSPDFAWIGGYRRVRSGRSFREKSNLFTRFAANIQWFQRPIGAVVEVAWFLAAGSILIAYL